MKPLCWALCFLSILFSSSAPAQSSRQVIFERISQYHHIQVYDEDNIRTLSFNGSWETRMSLTNPLIGHFEYTEYFQTPFIWNTNIHRVLMAGLGGGSTQRAYQHYFPAVLVDTVEIDPVVAEVAETYFHVVESPTLHLHTNDARLFLRRANVKYDVILMDAYATTRYGSSIPPQLVTQEFFQIALDHLTTNGVLAYNVIGQINGYRQNLVGALYRTLKSVFPQVYFFPATESQNVVLVATRNPEAFTRSRVEAAGQSLIDTGLVKLPTFADRLKNFVAQPPPNAATATILTDEFSPVESLMRP